MRTAPLAALVLLCGCLQSPPGGGDPSAPDAAADPDAAAPACATAFAVAYVNRLTVHPEGGAYVGLAVIEALGDGVNLDYLREGEDDSFVVELELSQVAYELTPRGGSRGLLEPAAEGLIVGEGLIDRDAWDGAAPTFQLTFEPVADDEPPAHVQAPVQVGDSAAVLRFDIEYDPSQQFLAVPGKATRVFSACDN